MMKQRIPNFDNFIVEASKNKAKYVWWEPVIFNGSIVQGIDVTFHNTLEYHSSIVHALEQHHPDLFYLDGNFFKRTELGLKLGIVSPSDSYSLRSGLVNKAFDFLSFWKNDGYELVYKEETLYASVVNRFIKKYKLEEFTKLKV